MLHCYLLYELKGSNGIEDRAVLERILIFVLHFEVLITMHILGALTRTNVDYNSDSIVALRIASGAAV